MRIRTIKPEFWRDPDSTGRWPLDLRCFYIGMWGVADDQGRFAWVPDLIAADLFPLDRRIDVGDLLARLEATGCAVRYEVDGRAYGWLPTFAKHQKIDRPTRTRLPDPPEGLDEHSARIRRGLVAVSRDLGSKVARENAKQPSARPPVLLPAKEVKKGKSDSPSVEPLRLRLVEQIRSREGVYVEAPAAERSQLKNALASPGVSEEGIVEAFSAVYARGTWKPRIQDVARVLSAARERHRGGNGVAAPVSDFTNIADGLAAFGEAP